MRSDTVIVRNVAWLFIAQAITWSLAIVQTVVTPRYLGPEGFGLFQVAFSLWSVVGVLATWGMDIYLTKEVARFPQRAGSLLRTSLLARTLLFAVFALGLAWYVPTQASLVEVLPVIVVIGVAQALLIYAGAFLAVLQGLELMRWSSLINICSKMFQTLVGIAVLVLGLGLYVFSWVLVIACLILTCSGFFLWRMRHTFTEKAPLTGRAMLASGSPYLLSMLVITAYGRVDILMLAALLEPAAVGWYSAAMTLFGTLLFMPTIISSAVFPALSRSHSANDERGPALIRKSFDLTLLIAVPLGFGLMIVSNTTVPLIFGEAFAPTAQVLMVMGLVLVFVYQNMILGWFMVSIDRQNTWTIVMALGFGARLGLNFLLIPWFQQAFGNGGVGAAVGFTVTECLIFTIGLFLIPKGTLTATNLVTASKIIVAGLLMLAACWWLRTAFPLVPVVVGACVYGCAVLGLRVLPNEDIALFRDYVQNKLSRLSRHLRFARERVS